MEILKISGDPNLAEVFVAKFRGDGEMLAEFVDAKEANSPRTKKWVVIVSTQFGCPVSCAMCDSGGYYYGDLSAEEMISQVEAVVERRGWDTLAKCEKFKVQFARMGEPALNKEVLTALRLLPSRFKPKSLSPCVATVAPAFARDWFEGLLEIKQELYGETKFQLQFSINSTSERERDGLMPIKKMPFAEIAKFGERFVSRGDRKAALNFALIEGMSHSAEVVAKHFSPESFCAKITPLNPTATASSANLRSKFCDDRISDEGKKFIEGLNKYGFDVILSVGDLKENEIGSNCGQSVRAFRGSPKTN